MTWKALTSSGHGVVGDPPHSPACGGGRPNAEEPLRHHPDPGVWLAKNAACYAPSMRLFLRGLATLSLPLLGSCGTMSLHPVTTLEAVQESYLDEDSTAGTRTWRLLRSGPGNQQLAVTAELPATLRMIEDMPSEVRETGLMAMRATATLSVFQTTSGAKGIRADRAYANGSEISIAYVDFDVSATSLGGSVHTSVHERYRLGVPLGFLRVGEPLEFSIASIRGSRRHAVEAQAWMGLLMRAFGLVGEDPTPEEITAAEKELRALLNDPLEVDSKVLRTILGD